MGNRLRCHLSCKAALLAVNDILWSYNLFEISSAVHSLGTLFILQIEIIDFRIFVDFLRM